MTAPDTPDWVRPLLDLGPTNWFVAGTDTGVGKTHVATTLVRALRARGLRVAGFKPFCAGDRADVEQLQAAGCPGLSADQINPCWLRTPAAPWLGFRVEQKQFDPQAIRSAYQDLDREMEAVIVEGAGGWLTPVDASSTLEDWVREWQLPVILVAGNRLGVLNHTALTLHRIRQVGLTCRALVLNHLRPPADPAEETNAALLREQWPDLPLIESPPASH